MRYLLCLFVLLAACSAPPTQDQVISRAVKRNCEAQGAAAAAEVRQQSAQIVKEGAATNQSKQADVESKALKAQQDAFKSCMLKYAV